MEAVCNRLCASVVEYKVHRRLTTEQQQKQKQGPLDGDYFYAGTAVAGVISLAYAINHRLLAQGLLSTLALVLLAARLWCIWTRVVEESLLVIQDLGVQLTTNFARGGQKSLFLDQAKIKSVVMNEAITMQKVVFYMTFIVEGRESMVVAFEQLQPRLSVLLPIYRETRALVMGPEGWAALVEEPSAEDFHAENVPAENIPAESFPSGVLFSGEEHSLKGS